MSLSKNSGNLADTDPSVHPTEVKESVVRAPAIFMSHGGGPCFFMEGGAMKHMDKNSPAADWYRNLAKRFIPTKPKAIIIISAHWEESDLHITSNPTPALFFDYYGFPPETYKLTYPAVADTALAQRIHSLFASAGIASQLDKKRDWDHGIFVPLKLIYPNADVPLVQISLNRNLDAAYHFRVGEILAPLRDEGYAIFGSGFATHNMRELMATLGEDKALKSTLDWVHWLTDSVTNNDPKFRKDRLVNWTKGPEARRAHPREEHLLPLHVVAGAASSQDKGAKEIYSEVFGAAALNCYMFE